MRQPSFFEKYFRGLLFILFFSIISVGLYSSYSLSRFNNLDGEKRQKDYVLVLAQLIPEDGLSDKRTAQDFVNAAAQADNLRITLIDPLGIVLADSHALADGMDNHNNRPEVIAARAMGTGASRRYSHSLKEDYQYTAALHHPSGQVLRISMAVGNIQENARRIYLQVIAVTLLILLLATILSYSQARNISRMLDSLRLTMMDYASGDFSQSLCLTGFREAVELSQTVNTMGKQLFHTIQQITWEKEKSQAMLEHMSEPVLRLDSNLNIQDANQAALLLARLELSQCTSRNLLQVFRSLELCELAEDALACNEDKSKLIHWKEEGRFLQVHGGLLKQEEETEPSLLIVMNDVTQIKQLELMRRDFVGNVSHELRTPITSILGFTETLTKWKSIPPEKVDRFLTILTKQAERLARIIDDLLTLSALEEDQELWVKGKYSADQLISGAIEFCSLKAEQKNISLHKDFEGDVKVQGHANLIEQALVNYIDNAIKYSPEGSDIKIQWQKTQYMLEIHVIDQGPGIPHEKQNRIFERFYVVDKARSRDVGGTGLGLSIVKHIAQKLQGRVDLISKAGAGSDFILALPLA